MNDLKHNLKFNYLYRDSGNYKQFGSIVFSNPNRLSERKVDSALRSLFIDSKYFVHTNFNIPSLFFENTNSEDHDWHEYESIIVTDENPTDNRTIEELIKRY